VYLRGPTSKGRQGEGEGKGRKGKGRGWVGEGMGGEGYPSPYWGVWIIQCVRQL